MVRSTVAFFALAGSALGNQAESGAQKNHHKWHHSYNHGTPKSNHNTGHYASPWEHAKGLNDLDVNALTSAIDDLLAQPSNPHWPADGGNYGPLLIRLAWHSSGSYRVSDGKGGVSGGRQRFEPERSWADNTNLDKARALLAPIKAKFGNGLSWGDLIATAGTTALRRMGTPITQFCLGRMDDFDGTNSDALGPSDEQRDTAPCEVDGQCKEPLGTTTLGLIYLNPEGPVVEAGGSPVPDPALSVNDIRDTFSRMGHDDRATVALIGGGHAFGKCHGACPAGPGLSPMEAYTASQKQAYQGECGQGSLQGKGENTFTSGFEGPWTSQPAQWDNEFFTMTLDREWEKHKGPGDHWQWRIKNATKSESGLMRLTSDIALLEDSKYFEIVKEFAADQEALGVAFDEAWFKLTHSGGVWSSESKCDTGTMPAWVIDQQHHRMLDTDFVIV